MSVAIDIVIHANGKICSYEIIRYLQFVEIVNVILGECTAERECLVNGFCVFTALHLGYKFDSEL